MFHNVILITYLNCFDPLQKLHSRHPNLFEACDFHQNFTADHAMTTHKHDAITPPDRRVASLQKAQRALSHLHKGQSSD